MTGGAIMRAGAVIVVVAAAFCAVAAAPSKPAQNGGRSNPAASAKTAAKPIAKPAVKIPENLDGDPVWGQFPAVMAEYRGGKVTREEFVRYALAASARRALPLPATPRRPNSSSFLLREIGSSCPLTHTALRVNRST